MAEMSEDKFNFEMGMAAAAARAQAAAGALAYSRAPAAINGQPLPPAQSEGALANLNRGIANAAGAPVDIIDAGLGLIGLSAHDLGAERPFGGSESITSGLNAIGIGASSGQPVTLGDKIMRGGGEAAAMAVPMLGAVNRISRGAGVAANVAGEIASPFIGRPITAITGEILAGMGGAAGQAIAEADGTGPVTTALASIIGSALGSGAAYAPASLLVSGPTARLARKGITATVAPFTDHGGRAIAAGRLGRLSADVEGQANMIVDAPSDPMSLAAFESMTPAQRTGDQNLMALERLILAKDATLRDQFSENTAETSNLLRQAFVGNNDGSAADLIAQIRSRRGYYESLIDQRVRQALDAARQNTENLVAEQDPFSASLAVRDELEIALADVKAQEAQLWSRVPQDEVVGTTNLDEAWAGIDAETAKALKEFIPATAARLLRDGNGIDGTVREVRGLYTNLGSVIRANKAKPGMEQTVRFATILQDAIRNDLGAVDPTTPTGRLINEASEFTANRAATFGQGTIGRLLEMSANGGNKLDPRMTLQNSVGRSGDISAIAVDDIRRALAGQPGGENVERIIGNYILRNFDDYVNTNGIVDPNKATRFLRRNRTILERYPGETARMIGARDSAVNALARERNAATTVKNVNSPRTSVGAAFEQARRGNEAATIFNSDDPLLSARRLLNVARRDESGRAENGLKNSISEYFLSQSRAGGIDGAGERITSGRRLTALMAEPTSLQVLNAVFTPAERNRMTVIARYMSNMEASQGRLPSVGPEVVDDIPSRAISIILRVKAAGLGSSLSRTINSGTGGDAGPSLQAAQIASGNVKRWMGELTEGKATKILTAAIQDPRLFRALMLDPAAAPPREVAESSRYLSRWITGYLAQDVSGTEEQQGGPQ